MEQAFGRESDSRGITLFSSVTERGAKPVASKPQLASTSPPTLSQDATDVHGHTQIIFLRGGWESELESSHLCGRKHCYSSPHVCIF